VPRPSGCNVVTGKWIWTIKRLLMVLRSATRRVGSFGGSLSVPVWTMIDFQSSGEACYSAQCSLFGSLLFLARTPVRCQECISSWHSDRDYLLQPASRVCGLQLSGFGLPVEQVSLWFEADSSGMVLSVCHLLADAGVC
jgi:hypothetical protein